MVFLIQLMYMHQSLRLLHALLVRQGAACPAWTCDTHLKGSGTLITYFSQSRRLSDNRDHKAHKMSKKALILVADGTEEMEL